MCDHKITVSVKTLEQPSAAAEQQKQQHKKQLTNKQG